MTRIASTRVVTNDYCTSFYFSVFYYLVVVVLVAAAAGARAEYLYGTRKPILLYTRVAHKQQEAQLPLREQGVSVVHSFHHNATLEHLAF